MLALLAIMVLLSQQAEHLLDARLLLSESMLLVGQQPLIAQLVIELLLQASHLLHSVMFALLAILVLQS